MATIEYKCDTCKRKITLSENETGMTVFAKCIITEGCKGTLYKLTRNSNIVRQDLIFPPPVDGLDDYTPRRAFYDQTFNILANPWAINHDMGVLPAITVYLFDDITGVPEEISQDEYTVNIIDEDNLEILFSAQKKGIVHLVARSSVPVSIATIPDANNLFQVSNIGYMTLIVPSIVNVDDDPSGQVTLNLDDLDLEVVVQAPADEEVTNSGTFLLDALTSQSPWFGWSQVLVRKRRNFSTKSIQLWDLVNPNPSDPTYNLLADIPDGTSIEITAIRYRNTAMGYLGEYIDIEPRSLMLLLGNSPYSATDKIRDQLVDVGRLPVTTNGTFYVFGGELYIDNSILETVYPQIELIDEGSIVVTPTTTAPVTPTPTTGTTVTPTPTMTVTPAITPTMTVTPSEVGFVNLTYGNHILSNDDASGVFYDIEFTNNGLLNETGDAGVISARTNEWWSITVPVFAIGADYEIRLDIATIVQPGGDPTFISQTGAPVGIWTTLGANKDWQWFVTGGAHGPNSGTVHAEFSIRDVATMTIQDTFVLDLEITTLPLPSVTPTVTPPSTPSVTSTSTPTSTPPTTPPTTPAVTPTSTPTGTPGPTQVVTPTITSTPQPTSTVTPTSTADATVTPTVTPTISDTPVATPTNTPVVTPTKTPAVTPTVTPSSSTSGFVYFTGRHLIDVQSIFGPNPAQAIFVFQSNGQYGDTRIGGGGINPVAGQWWSNEPVTAIGSDYEIKMDYIVGNDSAQSGGPAEGIWHSLSSSRLWSWSFSGSGYYSATILISIRDAATQTIQDTGNINIFLERTA